MTGFDWTRIQNSVLFFIVTLAGVILAAGVPKTVEGWILAICTALVGGYGKYSTETRLFYPNREAWPEQKRELMRALMQEKLAEGQEKLK